MIRCLFSPDNIQMQMLQILNKIRNYVSIRGRFMEHFIEKVVFSFERQRQMWCKEMKDRKRYRNLRNLHLQKKKKEQEEETGGRQTSRICQALKYSLKQPMESETEKVSQDLPGLLIETLFQNLRPGEVQNICLACAKLWVPSPNGKRS